MNINSCDCELQVYGDYYCPIITHLGQERLNNITSCHSYTGNKWGGPALYNSILPLIGAYLVSRYSNKYLRSDWKSQVLHSLGLQETKTPGEARVGRGSIIPI
jgi:hypothetical protein